MDAVTYAGNDLEVLADMPNYYSWIMESFGPHVRGQVVEYGAGVGTISARLTPLAGTLTIVEPSPNLAARLRDRFAASPNVRIVPASLETHVAQLPRDSVDTLVLVNVLEHIADDRAALRQLVEALRPGGHLLLFVPALQFLTSRLDRDLGHHRRYHKPDLVGKVTAAGAAVQTCRYVDLLGVFSWLIVNTMMGATAFNPALVAVNDRYAVAFTRRIEKMLGAPFGKNLVLVARKD